MKPSRALEIADDRVHAMKSRPPFVLELSREMLDHACDCLVMARFLYSFDEKRQLPTCIEWAKKALALLDHLPEGAVEHRGYGRDAVVVAIELLEAVYGVDESKASISPNRHA